MQPPVTSSAQAEVAAKRSPFGTSDFTASLAMGDSAPLVERPPGPNRATLDRTKSTIEQLYLPLKPPFVNQTSGCMLPKGVALDGQGIQCVPFERELS